MENHVFKRILKKRYDYSNSEKLMSGWITSGPYVVKKTLDAGKVRYPLAGALL